MLTEPIERSLIILYTAPLASSNELAAKLSFTYQVPIVSMGSVIANAVAAKAAEAKAAAEAAKAEAIEAGEEPPEDLGEIEVPSSLDDEGVLRRRSLRPLALRRCQRAASWSCRRCLTQCTTDIVLSSINTALTDEPKWCFTVDLPEAEIAARADAQHAERVAAMPTAGAEPDTDEADYDTLTEAKRLEFETKRRAHRRQVAVVEARIKASEIAHGHRSATLKEEHEAFLGRLEGVLSTYKGEAQDYEPPPPPAEGEVAEPEPIGLPGVWALDPLKPPPSPEEGEEGAGGEAVDVAEPEEEEAEKPDYLESVVAECLTHLRTPPPPIPEKEPDPDIPIPYTKQILKRPRPRKPASAPPGLVLLTLPPPPPPPVELAEGEEGRRGPCCRAGGRG